MADNSGNSNSGLAFIVGGLLVAVAVLAVVLFSNGTIQAPAATGGSSTTNNFERNLNLKVDPPKVEVPAMPAAPNPAPATAPAE